MSNKSARGAEILCKFLSARNLPPLLPLRSHPKPQGPLALALLKANADFASSYLVTTQLLLAIKPLLARTSPTLCPHSFRGEAGGQNPTKTVQITTFERGRGLRKTISATKIKSRCASSRSPPQDKQIGPTQLLVTGGRRRYAHACSGEVWA